MVLFCEGAGRPLSSDQQGVFPETNIFVFYITTQKLFYSITSRDTVLHKGCIKCVDVPFEWVFVPALSQHLLTRSPRCSSLGEAQLTHELQNEAGVQHGEHEQRISRYSPHFIHHFGSYPYR